MKKIEIIANLSVEEDIMQMLEKVGIKAFTKIPVVHGMGNSNPKMGDSIWPEENFMLIVYTDEIFVNVLIEEIAKLKKKFPDEGIKYFALNVERH
jgi:nitrogen regulatory protein PII